MPIDLETSREYSSLIGSMIALCSTFYFWLIRSNRERADLVAHRIGDLEGSVLWAMDDATTYRRVSPGDGEVVLKYWLHIAVVNNSTLPNAILGAEVFLQLADGTWQAVDVHHEMAEEGLFPTNINPLTTASLRLALAFKHPGTLEGGNAERRCAAGDALPEQVPIRIRLHGLNDQTFRSEILDPGNGLSRTVADNQRLAA